MFWKIITHPTVMLASIALILVVGESSAGIFGQILIMNLIISRLFAVIGFVGLLLLFFGWILSRKYINAFDSALINSLGAFLIMVSVILFFYGLPDEGKSQTFNSIIPVCTILLAALTTGSYLIKNLQVLFKRGSTG